MKPLFIACLLVAFGLLGQGCEPDCGEVVLDGTGKPKIKCNINLKCPGRGGGPLSDKDDLTMPDKGSTFENTKKCEEWAQGQPWIDKTCSVESSPAVLCVDQPLAGPSPVLAVGVGAASGDYGFDEDDLSDRSGAGGFGAQEGEAGNGGL